jgi:hypothetical protein
VWPKRMNRVWLFLTEIERPFDSVPSVLFLQEGADLLPASSAQSSKAASINDTDEAHNITLQYSTRDFFVEFQD